MSNIAVLKTVDKHLEKLLCIHSFIQNKEQVKMILSIWKTDWLWFIHFLLHFQSLETSYRHPNKGNHCSHFFHSMPSGALTSTCLVPTSFQFVLRTVPPDSICQWTNIGQCIISVTTASYNDKIDIFLFGQANLHTKTLVSFFSLLIYFYDLWR